MRREFTLAGNQKLQLAQVVQVLAGTDVTGEPRMLKVNADGSLPLVLTESGFVEPVHNGIAFDNYGSTNNLETITYKLNGTSVGIVTFTYVGGGALDNDALTGWSYAAV